MLRISPLTSALYAPAFGVHAHNSYLKAQYQSGTSVSPIDANTLLFLSHVFQNTPYPFQKWVREKQYTPENLQTLRDTMQTHLESIRLRGGQNATNRGVEGRVNAVFLYYGLSPEYPIGQTDTTIAEQLGCGRKNIMHHRERAMDILKVSLAKSLKNVFTQAGFDMKHLSGPNA